MRRGALSSACLPTRPIASLRFRLPAVCLPSTMLALVWFQSERQPCACQCAIVHVRGAVAGRGRVLPRFTGYSWCHVPASQSGDGDNDSAPILPLTLARTL